VAGAYCVLFAGCVWVLVRRRRDSASGARGGRAFIDALSVFIFATLTIVRRPRTRRRWLTRAQHVGCSIYARYQGLVVRGGEPLAAVLYLMDSATPPGQVGACTYGLSAVAIDVMLVRRPPLPPRPR
jgi:hypothetical protein